MENKKSDRICSDCIHFKACQSWTSGILENTDARPCRNYETIVDSNAYYLGQVDADKRNKPERIVYKEWHGQGDGVFVDGVDYLCPNCGKLIGKHGQAYCQDCGQALDWRDN